MIHFLYVLTLQRIPIYLWDIGGGDNFYGFPYQESPNDGVKVAMHQRCKSHLNAYTCTPETVDRTVHEDEVEAMRRILRDRIPSLSGELVHVETCMYTVTPDEHL